ncbi:MAG: glycoside hydrolase [Acidobacteriia bacterium]|nr:glycoside hydrolase [Terriglobia bacterium]
MAFYGSNGAAYFITFLLNGDANPITHLAIYRSEDSGLKWSVPSLIEGPFLDQPKVAVDQSKGKFRGNIYISFAQLHNPHATMEIKDYHICVFRSTDSGKTWEGPFDVANNHATRDRGLLNSDPAVFSDGELFVPFSEIVMDPRAPGGIGYWYVTSKDGGKSYSAPARLKLSDGSLIIGPYCPTGATPVYAIDHSDGPSKDRVYAAWMSRCYSPNQSRFMDGSESSTPARLLISSSSDHGRTWTNPVEVDSPAVGGQFGPHAIAVNKSGVVALSWYDTRDTTTKEHESVSRYFAASVDGGKSFLPAVAVSSVATDPTQEYRNIAGTEIEGNTVFLLASETHEEYNGMTADADGLFHVIWKDGRTGSYQLWTASVRVSQDENESVRTNFGADLVDADVSDKIQLEADPMLEFAAPGTIELPLRIKNKSALTLYPPIRLTITQLNNAATLRGADNGEPGAGAAFDYSKALGGFSVLTPGASSEDRILQFLKSPNPIQVPIFQFKVTARIDSTKSQGAKPHK